ncbi:type III secretion protein U [Roseateles sp. YR242]|uniref:EscU/YscU/HrcU family type III secretion system export apparatus switch protein n=1 Tax=Roseateles sp. YR242 TaxID=1855305 RepID=UPI0008BB6C30|nr:EscU/YscU/HrcU family type III secretion system export apparatus switch protein [Roseateles sp. YR242]SEK63891.1 type III secretion protein U [Roseateles sp. YR242]
MSEKNKPPSQKRIDEAREQGQVAQTPSIPHFLAAIGSFELVMGSSNLWLSQAVEVMGSYIERLGATSPQALTAKDLLVPLGGLGLTLSLGLLMAAVVLGLAGNLLQTGVVVATGGFLKFDRLDPVQHVKQWFSAEQLGKLGMDIVKVALIFGCGGLGVLMSLDSLMHLADGTLIQGVQVVLDMLLLCERLSLIPIIACVAVDWWLRRRSHMKSLMMSEEEVKREQKDQLGDPHVRSKRNEFRRDVLGGELTESTRRANAVVTNPTHYAVALLYDPSKYPLPVVLAKGADETAALMRQIARANDIPIIRSPQLARLLFRTGREWQPVPRLALKAVAAVYRVVAEIRAGERRLEDVHAIEADDGRGPL